MDRKLKRVLMMVAGWAFVLLGILGLFLPLLQGVLFLFVGLLIFSRFSETAQGIERRVSERHPRLAAQLERAHRVEDRVLGWFAATFRGRGWVAAAVGFALLAGIVVAVVLIRG